MVTYETWSLTRGGRKGRFNCIKQFYSFNFLFLTERQITENAAQRVQGDCKPFNSSTGSARVFYMFYIKEEIALFDEHIFSRDTVII